MPTGRVWIYRLLFCLFVCLFVRLRIYPARIKLAASNFARWFIGVLGRKSPPLGNFFSPRSLKSDQLATTWKYCIWCKFLPHRKRHARDVPFVEYRAACGRRSACVDIRPYSTTDVGLLVTITVTKRWRGKCKPNEKVT